MMQTNMQKTVHDLGAAGAEPKLAAAMAQAIRTDGQRVAQPARCRPR